MQDSIQIQSHTSIQSKIKDIAELTKLRLSLLVVFSAAVTYLFASVGSIDWLGFILLILGGFLVTGSANGMNQILEKDLDQMMDRTKDRPVAASRMSVTEAWVICILFGVVGIFILQYFLNYQSALLGLSAIILYVLAYTPMKRQTPFAVFVGAIPGSIPAMLGYVAATGQVDMMAWLFFLIQFFWQFPHFWAIAWRLDDDYKKAGFNLLPSGGRNKAAAFQTIVYTSGLLAVSLLPFFFKFTGNISAIIVAVSGIWFLYYAVQLYNKCSMEAASRLMFGSFIYLPVVFIALLLDKI
ncbi:MAG: protoheme IX farnesyltransferase [Bacteroidia bacterium]|nr:protoheme IX farnesyltransferase [Bacteroidia bacterium]